MPPSLPLLYSFRRCPFAMRARLALWASGVAFTTVEVALKAKPPALLEVSPKGTVPVLVLPDGRVLDESLAIMEWALAHSDPYGWLYPGASKADSLALIAHGDGPFKRQLDTYKYPERSPPGASFTAREEALVFLRALDARLTGRAGLVHSAVSLADIALFPLIRQFAAVDPLWVASAGLTRLASWLEALVSSEGFLKIMANPKS